MGMWQRLKRHKWLVGVAMVLGTIALVAVAFLVGSLARNGPPEEQRKQSDPIPVYVAPPVNLTGQEALTRALEKFNDTLAARTARLSDSLQDLLTEAPRTDALRIASIRLNGGETEANVKGAPVDHPLFDWKSFDANNSTTAPDIKVLPITQAEAAEGKLPAYQVRLSSAKGPHRALRRETDQITLEVVPPAANKGHACYVKKELQELFPKDRNDVVLEWVIDVVVSCILDGTIGNDVRQETHLFSDLYGLLFESHDTIRRTAALKGADRYEFFLANWQERPDEARVALTEAIDAFQDAAKPSSDDDTSRYPMAEYLYAHALTTAIIGPAGTEDFDSDKRQTRVQELKKYLPTAFSSPPFRCALWAKAMAEEAANSPGAVDAWTAVVDPKEKSNDSAGDAGESCNERAQRYMVRAAADSSVATRSTKNAAGMNQAGTRARIKARTRLLLLKVRRTLDVPRTEADREAITLIGVQRKAIEEDVASLRVDIDRKGDPDAGDPEPKPNPNQAREDVEDTLTKTGLDLDLAYYYVIVAGKAENLRLEARLSPNIIEMSKKGLDELRGLVVLRDSDLCGKAPELDPAVTQRCEANADECTALHLAVDAYLRAVGEWFWAGALRKFQHAEEQSRNMRKNLCSTLSARERLSACDDVAEGSKTWRESMEKANAVYGVKALDALESSAALFLTSVNCYLVERIPPSACEGATPVPVSATTEAPVASAGPRTGNSYSTSRRWLLQPRFAAVRNGILAGCALRRAAATTKSGQAALDKGRFGALLDTWIENPPTPAVVEAEESALREAVGADAYQQLVIPRLMMSYAVLWPATRSYPPLRTAEVDVKKVLKEQMGKVTKTNWNETTLLEAFRSMWKGIVPSHGQSGLTDIGVGQDINDKRAVTSSEGSADKTQNKDLTSCGRVDTDPPPPGCLLRGAYDVYEQAVRSRASTLAVGSYARDPLQEALIDAANDALLRKTAILERADSAYWKLVFPFLQEAGHQLPRLGDNHEVNVRSLRIAFYRVLLTKGSPIPIAQFPAQALGVLVQMLHYTPDMEGMEVFVVRDAVELLAQKHGIRFTGGKDDKQIKNFEGAVAGAGNGPCSDRASLLRFFSFVSTQRELYRTSGLLDPHVNRSMRLQDNLSRWCEHRSLAVTSEMVALSDLLRADWGRPSRKGPGDPMSRVAHLIGDDSFLKYAYGRFLLLKKDPDPDRANRIAGDLRFPEARLLSARAQLGMAPSAVNASQAGLSAWMAERGFATLCRGETDVSLKGCVERGISLDGALYRTIGDAAAQAARAGGMISGSYTERDDESNNLWRAGKRNPFGLRRRSASPEGPRPEYNTAVRAYRKALTREELEGVESDMGGVRLRLAAALIELDAFDDAVRETEADNEASGVRFFDSHPCKKATLLSAIARWGRGEKDTAREMSKVGDLSLFDFDGPIHSQFCRSDLDSVFLGFRGRQLRRSLLQDRATRPNSPSSP